MWGRDGLQRLSTEKNPITWGHSVQGQRGPPQKDYTESPGRLSGGLHDRLTEGGGKLILIHLHRWIKMFSSRCAQKLRKLCEQCQALRTKTLRWHQSHQKRRTSQMANFRSSEAGTNAGFYLQCFREVTGPWYNKHINMKEGGALQANTGVA